MSEPEFRVYERDGKPILRVNGVACMDTTSHGDRFTVDMLLPTVDAARTLWTVLGDYLAKAATGQPIKEGEE